MNRLAAQALVVVAGLLLLSSSSAWAIVCQANLDCNTKVDLSDLVIMKLDFNKTGCDACMCNPNSECPTGMTECSGVCVDPMTDEAYCGSCSNSCTSGEICVAGSCEIDGSVYEAAVPRRGRPHHTHMEMTVI